MRHHITSLRSTRILGTLLLGSIAACDPAEEASADPIENPDDAMEFREVASLELDDGSTLSFLQFGEGVLVGGQFDSDSLEINRVSNLIETWGATPLEIYQSLTDAPIPEALELNHGSLAEAGQAYVQPRDLGRFRLSVWDIGAPDCSSEAGWESYWGGIYSSYTAQAGYREPSDPLNAGASLSNGVPGDSYVRLGMCAESTTHTFPIFSHFTMSARRPQDEEWTTAEVVLEDGTQARYYWAGAVNYRWMVETQLALNSFPPLGAPGNGVAVATRKFGGDLSP